MTDQPVIPVGTRIRLKSHAVWPGYEGVVRKLPSKDEPKHVVRLKALGPWNGYFDAHATFEQMERL